MKKYGAHAAAYRFDRAASIRNQHLSKYNMPERLSKKPIASVILGIVAGVLLILGIVWYVKGPAFLALKEKTGQQTTPTSSNLSSSTTANRFTFHDILQDGKDPAFAESDSKKRNSTPIVTDNRIAAYLQVGTFKSPMEADAQKAKLALLGIESAVKNADIPQGGTVHKVSEDVSG